MRRLDLLRKFFNLGADTLEGVRIAALYIFYFAAARVGISPRSTQIRACVNGVLCPITVKSISDFWTIKDIFLEKEYEINLNNPKIIADLGANIGISAIFFATRFPNTIVHAVEPNPIVFRQLIKNTARISNIICYPFAITDKNGIVTFENGVHNTSASLKARGGGAFEAPSKTMESFMQEAGLSMIDLVKFDIEGAEEYLFRNFPERASVRAYIGEMHYDLMDLTHEELKSFFPGHQIEERFMEGKKRSVIRILAPSL